MYVHMYFSLNSSFLVEKQYLTVIKMATSIISVGVFLFFFPLHLYHLHNEVLLISTFNIVLKKGL